MAIWSPSHQPHVPPLCWEPEIPTGTGAPQESASAASCCFPSEEPVCPSPAHHERLPLGMAWKVPGAAHGPLPPHLGTGAVFRLWEKASMPMFENPTSSLSWPLERGELCSHTGLLWSRLPCSCHATLGLQPVSGWRQRVGMCSPRARDLRPDRRSGRPHNGPCEARLEVVPWSGCCEWDSVHARPRVSILLSLGSKEHAVAGMSIPTPTPTPLQCDHGGL